MREPDVDAHGFEGARRFTCGTDRGVTLLWSPFMSEPVQGRGLAWQVQVEHPTTSPCGGGINPAPGLWACVGAEGLHDGAYAVPRGKEGGPEPERLSHTLVLCASHKEEDK